VSGLANDPAVAGGAGDRNHGARARERTVVIYVALSLLLLTPGLLAAARIELLSETVLGIWLKRLDGELQQIAFGHTPRFWMGVAGATMLALLLVYPLRKRFGVGSAVSVAAWFHVHTALGLLGPVLILYHCYFGMGSTPANVALITLMVVTVSGIFGHFVYARVSASFHGEKKRAEDHLLDAKTELLRLTATSSRAKVFEAIETFERQPDGERRGLWPWASPYARQGLTEHAQWLIENQGPQEGWSETRCRETAARVQMSLAAYLDALSRAARRSALERVAGIWRLFHLPLFCVTVVAALIHVSKVWNLDGPAPVVQEQVADARAAAGEAKPGLIATRKVTTSTEAPPGDMPRLVEPPRPAPRRAPSTAGSRADGPPAGAGERTAAGGEVARQDKAKPPRATSDPIGELARRTAQPDNTGQLDPAAVLAQLARFKNDPAFDHGRNRFPLTGKHTSLGCESCHKTFLQDNPRRCVDCHKKDDVHRGRRPDCESCHLTSDWDKLKGR
jgi:hypothetical protein